MRAIVWQLTRLFGALVLAAAPPLAAQAQENFDDLFKPESFQFEVFRDPDSGFAMQFRLDGAGNLQLGAITAAVPGEDRDTQIAEAQSFAYDAARRSFAITLPRSETRLRDVAGAVRVIERAPFAARRLDVTLTAEDGASKAMTLTGQQLRLMGKPGCLVDAFPGANLSVMTIKAGYNAQRGDWIAEPAKANGWLVMRRRIDFLKGEDEFDIAPLPGRELVALAAIGALDGVRCISFGVDETDGADAIRIIDLPDGTLFTPDANLKPLEAIAARFQEPRFEGIAAGVEMGDVTPGTPARLVLIAPGRYFGLVQGSALPHRATFALQFGRSPNRESEVREALRFVLRDLTRQDAADATKFEAISLRPGETGSAFEGMQDWQQRFAAIIAERLKGQVN